MNKEKRILILGGLGFIGKNLYISLIKDNHDVTIVAKHIHENSDGFLTSAIRNNVVEGNILDKGFMENAVMDYDIIFSMAGSSGAPDSIDNPYHDLDTNLKGHLNLLEACRKKNPKAVLIFPSTRLVYGKPKSNPVSETHVARPDSIYAIHKLTTEYYYLLYQKLYHLNSIIFRISNPYGPYQRFGSHKYGIINWFIYKALADGEIDIYGDGTQKRDFIFINDLTRLFKLSMSNENLFGKIYNVGYGKGITLREAAEVIQKQISGTKINVKAWPSIDEKIETGDYISDIKLLESEIGWKPTVNFEDGMKETIKFYARETT